MHCHERRRKAWLFRVAAIASATIAATAMVLFSPWQGESASGHGSTIDPVSRNYGCWQRWGDDYQNPAMETEDPMCWQAWQADTTAMWNWNGLYREGVADNHEAAIPNGTLCSGGNTFDGRYDALDAPGQWIATPISDSSTFTVDVYDAANHGADYIKVYISKPGFDSTTMSLGWDNIELIAETGPHAPGEGTPHPEGGTVISVDASAPGLTGRHVVYTIWQASHTDQSFYSCADVNFG